MSVDENRNCGCGFNNNMSSNMENNMNVNMPETLNYSNSCQETQNTVDCCMQQEMLNQIMAYDFAINDLALYLDTHTDDEKALCLHRKYCKEAKELKDKYQKVFGPLTINFPCNKWRWILEPWPWEGGNY